MRLTAQGWNRDHGKVEICDIDLYEIEATTEQFTYGPNNPKLQVHQHPRLSHISGITLCCFAEMRLGGKYKVKLTIGKGEIARLFHLTHKREIDRLFGAQKDEAERLLGAQKDHADRFLAIFPQPDASKEVTTEQSRAAADFDPVPEDA
jgi:hypothetical protein